MSGNPHTMTDASLDNERSSVFSLEAALSAWVAFLSCLQIFAVALALFRVAMTQGVALVVLSLSAVAAAAWHRISRKEETPVPPAVKPSAPVRTVLSVAALLAATLYAILWAVVSRTPDLTCDGNSYHIPAVAAWASKGYIHWIAEGVQPNLLMYMNGYPKAAEVVGFVLAKACGGYLVNTVNLIFLPLGVLGVARLARRMGVSTAWSLAAGAMLVFTPVNIWQSPTTYVDSAYASAAIAFIALLAEAFAAEEHPWPAAVTLGGAMGLTLGVKGTGALTAVVGVGILLAFLLIRARRVSARAEYLRKRLLCVATACVIAAAVGGYWYVRNWVHTGSPLHPVGVKMLGVQVFPGLSVGEAIGEAGNTPPQYRSLPGFLRVLMNWAQTGLSRPETSMTVDSRTGGLGYLWLLGCVPAITVLLTQVFRRRPEVMPWRGVLLLLGTIVGVEFLVTPMQWWARYTLWLYALGLPCLAAAVSQRSPSRPARAWRFYLCLCIVAFLIEGGICAALAIRHQCFPWRGSWNVDWTQAGKYQRPTLFPNLRGTILTEIVEGSGGVATGPLMGLTPNTRSKSDILGDLGLPIGRRPYEFLPEEVTPRRAAALWNEGVRYVVWDGSMPVPKSLSDISEKIVDVPDFHVIVLRNPD
jgi:hypothetical protein